MAAGNHPVGPPARGRQRGQGGFTIVEVMIAVVVFALGFAGVMAMMLASVGANSSSRDLGGATRVAESVAEEFTVRGRNWTDGAPSLTFPEISGAQGTWMGFPAGSSFAGLTGNTFVDVQRSVTNPIAKRLIYCVNYQWTLTNPTPYEIAEVSVRVAFGKGGFLPASCAPATVTTELGNSNMSAVVIPVVVPRMILGGS